MIMALWKVETVKIKIFKDIYDGKSEEYKLPSVTEKFILN